MMKSLHCICGSVPDTTTEAFATHDPNPRTDSSCIFCRVSVDNGFAVVDQVSYTEAVAVVWMIDWIPLAKNDDFIVFKDHNPSAREHLLVIPRRHVGRYAPIF